MPKVSIVITCHNYAHYLPQAIESALRQTWENKEVIVVNDGSLDNTSEVAKRYPVILIEQENKGLSAARNAGMKAATGDYFMHLDADDWIDDDAVETCMGWDEDIIGFWEQEFGERDFTVKFPKEHPNYWDFAERNQMNCAAVFKRKVYETIGGYDESMKIAYEDWDYWLRATKQGFKVKILPVAIYHYRVHGDSMVLKSRPFHSEIKEYILKK